MDFMDYLLIYFRGEKQLGFFHAADQPDHFAEADLTSLEGTGYGGIHR